MRLPLFAAVLICSVATAHEVTLIPIRIQDGYNVASVSIDGVQLRAAIDTAGYHGIGISPAALARLDVRFHPTRVVRVDGGGHRFVGREFEVRELKIGNRVFREVQGYERYEAAAGEFGAAPFDAAIGRDFLERFTVIVDYPNHRIELHPAEPDPAHCGRPTAAIDVSRSGLVYSVVRTDAGPMRLAWDTGSTYSLIQKAVVSDRRLQTHDDRYVSHILMFGRHEFGPHKMVTLDLPGAADVDGVIGANFFARHRVCFSYATRGVSVR